MYRPELFDIVYFTQDTFVGTGMVVFDNAWVVTVRVLSVDATSNIMVGWLDEQLDELNNTDNKTYGYWGVIPNNIQQLKTPKGNRIL